MIFIANVHKKNHFQIEQEIGLFSKNILSLQC